MTVYGGNVACASKLAFFICISFCFSASHAAKLTSDCEFSIDLPKGVKLNKQSDTQPSLCSYLIADAEPTPFVNSVTVLKWNKLQKLQVNGEPLRDIGFFKLNKKSVVVYKGRPSYADTRNSYFQKVLNKPVKTSSIDGSTKVFSVRSELRVKWIKPLDQETQEETTATYVCMDTSISNDVTLAVINWCLPKQGSNISELSKITQSLRFETTMPAATK